VTVEITTSVETERTLAAGRPAVQARSLYRFFRAGDEETLALQGVSLAVERGEVVAVIGPSGSGKSTLLACLAGLDEPSGGSVHIAGHRISHQPEAVRARLRARHIGVLAQTGNLFEHLSVRSNVVLAQSLTEPRPAASVDDLLQSLGIAGRAGAYPSQLSGGELARAGLAAALANDPDVLLADEPSGELDGDTERKLISLLTERAGAGVAVLVASHSPAVAAVADRVISLTDGRISG
jgi:putative ABC transport system ATP-binding protein